jgi:hypothetical protein
MKLITAIIKPEQADNVKKALNKIGVDGLDDDRCQRIWQAERSYRILSRF